MAILWWAIILGLVVMSMTPGFRMRFGAPWDGDEFTWGGDIRFQGKVRRDILALAWTKCRLVTAIRLKRERVEVYDGTLVAEFGKPVSVRCKIVSNLAIFTCSVCKAKHAAMPPEAEPVDVDLNQLRANWHQAIELLEAHWGVESYERKERTTSMAYFSQLRSGVQGFPATMTTTKVAGSFVAHCVGCDPTVKRVVIEQYPIGTKVKVKRTGATGDVLEGSWSQIILDERLVKRGCEPWPEPAYLVGDTWYWHHELGSARFPP